MAYRKTKQTEKDDIYLPEEGIPHFEGRVPKWDDNPDEVPGYHVVRLPKPLAKLMGLMHSGASSVEFAIARRKWAKGIFIPIIMAPIFLFGILFFYSGFIEPVRHVLLNGPPPAEDYPFTVRAIMTFASLFIMGITGYPIAFVWGLDKRFIAFWDRKVPVLTKSQRLKEKMTITTGFGSYTILWSYTGGLLILGAGIYIIAFMIIADQLHPHIITAFILVAAGIIWVFVRNRVVIDKNNKTVTRSRSLFWWRMVREYKFSDCKRILLHERHSYMRMWNDFFTKIETPAGHVAPGKHGNTMRHYEQRTFKVVSIELNNGNLIEVQECGSLWRARRLTWRLSKYMGIEAVDALG